MTASQVARKMWDVREAKRVIVDAERQIAVLKNLVFTQQMKLEANCPHPPEHREQKESSIQNFDVCNLCGKAFL